MEEKQKALQGDPAWSALLVHLGKAFGPGPSAGPLLYAFALYSTPAGSGKVVQAGPGKSVTAGRGTGHWRAYDVGDGLVQSVVQSVFQDREGYLWFGTWGGVSRYDPKTGDKGAHSTSSGQALRQSSGQAWTTFTAKDGLANNWVWSILQDREGVLWFGTNGGGAGMIPFDSRTLAQGRLRQAQDKAGRRSSPSRRRTAWGAVRSECSFRSGGAPLVRDHEGRDALSPACAVAPSRRHRRGGGRPPVSGGGSRLHPLQRRSDHLSLSGSRRCGSGGRTFCLWRSTSWTGMRVRCAGPSRGLPRRLWLR